MQAILNADGRLEVFARGSDRALIHIWQNEPIFGLVFWSDWHSLGVPHPEFRSPDGRLVYGGLSSAPSVGRNADGRLEVFAVGSADSYHSDLVHIWQTAPSRGPWSGWASLGGQLKFTAPAVVRNFDGRLEVFACAPDNSLWHIWQTAPNNGWSSWASLGGALSGAPVVAKNADGRLEVFARGSDQQLWHIWQTAPNNGWSQWASMGRTVYGVPTVDRNADGRLEVFALSLGSIGGRLDHIWQTAPSNGWSGWAEDLLVLADYEGPGVAKNADGRLELVGGGRGAVTHQWQTAASNGWSGEEFLGWGGATSSTPVVVQNADGRLEVFIRGLDHRLYHISQTSPNNGWSDWEPLGNWLLTDAGRTLIEESGTIWGYW